MRPPRPPRRNRHEHAPHRRPSRPLYLPSRPLQRRRRSRRRAGALRAAALSLWRIRRNRRATLDLLDLDADRLADIGLTRADVHVALFDPPTPDPTGRLEAFAAERRRPGRRRA